MESARKYPRKSSAERGRDFSLKNRVNTLVLAPLAVSAFRGITGGYTSPIVGLAVVTIAKGALFYWGPLRNTVKVFK